MQSKTALLLIGLGLFVSSQFALGQDTRPELPRETRAPCCVSSPLPKFPGGPDSLMRYIYHNFRWPPNFCGEGIIVVAFTIYPDGRVDDPEIKRGLCKDCDQQAIKLICDMPNWLPSTGDEFRQPFKMHLPLRIRLE